MNYTLRTKILTKIKASSQNIILPYFLISLYCSPLPSKSKVIKPFQRLPIFSLIIVKEGLGIYQHRHNNIPLSALDQIIQSDSHGQLGFGHVKDLVLDVLDVEAAFL
jgi:hypothetical protein